MKSLKICSKFIPVNHEFYLNHVGTISDRPLGYIDFGDFLAFRERDSDNRTITHTWAFVAAKWIINPGFVQIGSLLVGTASSVNQSYREYIGYIDYNSFDRQFHVLDEIDSEISWCLISHCDEGVMFNWRFGGARNQATFNTSTRVLDRQ